MFSLLVAGSALMLAPDAGAQTKKPAAKKPAAAKPAAVKTDAAKPSAPNAAGFRKYKNVEYKIVKDVPGKNAAIGEMIEFHILAKCDTLILGNTWDKNGPGAGKPAQTAVQEVNDPTRFEGIFVLLSAGDSAVVNIPCDTILSKVPAEQKASLPPWLKSGNTVNIYLKIVSVKTQQQAEADAKKLAEELKAADDKALQDYFRQNNIKATKTASGLYYSVSKEGTGAKTEAGMDVEMNYTGKLLNGTIFDSNTDPSSTHKEPFKFKLGQHMVIPGWDEGIALFKVGTKASLYIPSALAYGAQAQGTIPANSVLMFDVEVLSAKTQEQVEAEAKAAAGKQVETDDKLIQDYLKKNNIKATKTASGLYYKITKEGTGPQITSGQKVAMRYAGKLLDGTEFDSNMGGGKPAFTFPVGQHQVIAGWDEGVALLKKGTKATFFIPSTLGYGARGAGPKIGPNSVLLFDVEVEDIVTDK